MDSLSLLSVRGLSKSFGGVRAVNNVDLQINKGEIHALIGANGAGKTSFVNLLCGLTRCDSGRVIFNSRDITFARSYVRVRAGMAYSLQHAEVFQNWSVYDNMSFAVMLRRRGDTEIMRLLRLFSLESYASVKTSELGHGHIKFLQLAMGFALSPILYIVDEPTQALSAAEIALFKEAMRGYTREGSVLLIEHNMDVVMDLAHRITVLDSGSVLASGSPKEIRASVAVRRAYLGENYAGD